MNLPVLYWQSLCLWKREVGVTTLSHVFLMAPFALWHFDLEGSHSSQHQLFRNTWDAGGSKKLKKKIFVSTTHLWSVGFSAW